LGWTARNIVTGLRGGCVLLLGTILISSCAAPRYSYVTDSGDKTYFKVPYGWQQLAPATLCDVLGKANNTTACPPGWYVVYKGGNQKPTESDLSSDDLSAPLAMAEVFPFEPTSTETTVTTEMLEDSVLPVTPEQQAEEEEEGFSALSFSLINQVFITSNGFRGVRETFTYTWDDKKSDTYGVAAFTNSNSTEVYELVVHCLTSCYKQDKTAFDAVLNSFTMRRY
jgi:hypothetical protein